MAGSQGDGRRDLTCSRKEIATSGDSFHFPLSDCTTGEAPMGDL